MAATDFVNGRFPCAIPDTTVLNYGGSDIAVGSCVKLDTGNVMGASQGGLAVVATSAVTDFPFGVVVEVVKAKVGSVPGTGRVQCVDGTCVWAIALGAISAGAIVGPSATSGQVTTYTATDPSLGQALTAAVNAADPVLVQLAKSRNA